MGTQAVNRPLYGTSSAAVITPADGGTIQTTRAIYVGTGGDIAVDLAETGTNIIYKNVPSGARLVIQATRVYSTGTTATDLLAEY